jgi:hypothetical protein
MNPNRTPRWVHIQIFWAIASLAGCRVENRILEATPAEPSLQFLSWAAPADAQPINTMDLDAYGEAVRIVTPSRPTALAGYGGAQRRLFPPRLYTKGQSTVFCKPYRTVDSPPRLKLSVYSGVGQEGRTALIFVNVDLVAVSQDVSQWLLNTARDVLGDAVELGQAHVHVTATHNHSGPAGLSLSPFWTAFACDSPQQFYRQEFEDAFRSALREAWENPVAIRALRTVRTEIDGFNESRIPTIKPSTTTLLWLPLEAGSGQPAGCQFSFPVHSTLKGPDSLALGRDLAGLLEDDLAEDLNLRNCFFLNGAAGNARARLSGLEPETYADNLAQTIATRAQTSTESTPQDPQNTALIREHTRITFGALKLELPRPSVNFSACGLDGLAPLISAKILDTIPRTTKAGWVRMGNDLTLLLPGELVSTAGEALTALLKEEDPTVNQVSYVTTANDYTGYVLRPEDYDGKSLEACSSLFGSGHLGSLMKALSKTVKATHQ